LEKAVAIDPHNVRGRELLAVVIAKKEGDRARTIMENVIKDDPHRPVALRTLGMIAMAVHDYDKAEEWFTKLQAERPLEDTSYLNLAGIYLLKKENAQAIGQLVELERHEQKDERIPRKLADLFQQEGQLAEAEQSAYRAIRINPYNAINHETMAQVLMEEKEPERAVEYWQHATELQPQVCEFWEGLADAEGQAGNAAAASAAAKKAVELQPNSPAKQWIKD